MIQLLLNHPSHLPFLYMEKLSSIKSVPGVKKVGTTAVNSELLNAEFQRILRRDNKAFLSDQWKEIEENNRMGKTRDLFKKIRDTKWTFHAKIGTIKGIDGVDLTEAEDIKKRWQEYTEELYKKDLHDPNNQMMWSLTWSQTFWNVKSRGP